MDMGGTEPPTNPEYTMDPILKMMAEAQEAGRSKTTVTEAVYLCMMVEKQKRDAAALPPVEEIQKCNASRKKLRPCYLCESRTVAVSGICRDCQTNGTLKTVERLAKSYAPIQCRQQRNVTGEKMWIAVGTPAHLNPCSETYWSM